MPQTSETAVLNACRVLFGSELRLGRDFLLYLQPGGLKKAFRTRAKETHPDRFGDCEPRLRQQQTRAFQDVRQAFEVVDTYLKRREKAHRVPPANAPRPPGKSTPPHRGRRAPKGNGPKRNAPGDLPARTFKFGAYLLHRGVISHHNLVLALVWQRAQRPAIGEIARRWGWLSEEDVQRILHQPGPYRPFGERAVALGLLSDFQVRTLLWHQRGQQKKLGVYFVEQGLVPPGEIERLVAQMKEHNARQAQAPRGKAAKPK